MGQWGRALENLVNTAFWRGKRVLVTGHTGFKGAWLCLMLRQMGAEVHGLALPPPAGPTAFDQLDVASTLAGDVRADIRDPGALVAAVAAIRPEIVLHLAAQAYVGRSYREPTETFATNVTGTINLMQALRGTDCRAAVMVTSDKVYRNDGTGRAFTESDPLGGHDPYSASKAGTEIAVACWRSSFADALPRMATARAGNVIGGGDFGEQRLVPDLVRAQMAGQPLAVRRPDATRPFQHVLDVLRGYLMLAEALVAGTAPPALNFGPHDSEVRVRDLLRLWGQVDWRQEQGEVMAEAPRLGLDSSLAGQALGWAPRCSTPQAIAATARWYAAWRAGQDMARLSRQAVESAL